MSIMKPSEAAMAERARTKMPFGNQRTVDTKTAPNNAGPMTCELHAGHEHPALGRTRARTRASAQR